MSEITITIHAIAPERKTLRVENALLAAEKPVDELVAKLTESGFAVNALSITSAASGPVKAERKTRKPRAPKPTVAA
jgi:hypothetical protein